jgi:hypothetical protein
VTGDKSVILHSACAERRAFARPGLRAILLAGMLLGTLAVVPYFPVLSQPFISDDYIQIALGRKYGAMDAWGALLNDALYRCRATSIVMTLWTERLFGTTPLPFYATSMLMHVLNTLLVWVCGWRLGLGLWRSWAAAVFFGIYLGHQEAVMWYAALPELLVFFFSGLFLLSWDAYARRGGTRDYALAALWFVLALGSKESGVVLVPVAALLAWRRGRSMLTAAPLAALSAVYAWGIFAAKEDHLHLNDGTFSLHAPFVATWARSMGRMFWVWALLATLAVAAWRRPLWRGLRIPAVWMSIALLPYSFLLYMPVIPSRHTYLASAGLGFVVAAGFSAMRWRFRTRRWLLAAIALLCVAHHTGYLWTKKRMQFLRRAESTEELVQLARETSGLIYVSCFPYAQEVAEQALIIRLGQSPSRLVFTKTPPPGVVTYCAPDP